MKAPSKPTEATATVHSRKPKRMGRKGNTMQIASVKEHAERKSNSVSDGSDESPQPFSRPRKDDADNDPIVLEFGPLITVNEKQKVTVNQIAVAAKFTSDYQIAFDEVAGHMRRYNPETGVWGVLKDPPAKLLLGSLLKKIAENYDAKALLMQRTNSLLGSILSLVKGHAVMGEPNSQTDSMIHVGNGMLDLSSGKAKLLPFGPEHFSRKACPLAHDPKARCPRFVEELLRPALPDEDDVRLLQRYAGAVLLGHNYAQRFLLLHGGAAGGKSTLITVIERIVGLANVASLRTGHLTGRFEAHGFQNKTLLTAKDVPEDFLSNAGAKMIKSLVGDDQMETELKYGGKFQLRGKFNVIITSNGRLRLPIEEDDAAWRRRLLVLNFDREKAPKRVANFAETLLQTEGEGILAWMVEGAMQHLHEIQTKGDFTLTQPQVERIESLLLESKSPSEFISASVKKDKKAAVAVDELLHAYFAFCKAKGWTPVSLREFTLRLPDLMITAFGVHKRNDIERAGKSVRGFKGVALVSHL